MKNLKIFPAFLILALAFCGMFSSVVFAGSTIPRLIDDADLLTVTESQDLLSSLDEISEKYSQDIAIVTVNSLNGKTPATFAREFYENANYGFGESYSGILLLISMEQRDYYILVSGDAQNIFSEGDLNSLESAFFDHLSEGNYYEAFCAFADECEYIIKYDGKLSPVWIFISLLAGAAIAAFVIWQMVSKHKAVKPQKSANEYMLRDSFRLDRSRDVFLFSHVTRVVKPQNNSSGRSSSSGGRSYSGRGGKF